MKDNPRKKMDKSYKKKRKFRRSLNTRMMLNYFSN